MGEKMKVSKASRRAKIIVLDDNREFAKSCIPLIREAIPRADVFLCDSPCRAQSVGAKFHVDFVISNLDFGGEERKRLESFLTTHAELGARIMLWSALEEVPKDFEQATKAVKIIFHNKQEGPEAFAEKLKELRKLNPKPFAAGHLFHWATSAEFLSKYHVAPPRRSELCSA
ncbi:MAG: hypothetical protein ABH854_05735 [Candidatus Diapherotrites archaeon]